MTAGTVALIFLLWGPPASPGGSPAYQRSALPAAQPGEQTTFLRPGTFKYDFYDAKARLEGGLNSTGSFAGNSAPFLKLPAHTLQGCRAYIRAHIRDYEAAAEGMGKTIEDVRCIVIPPQKMLGHYTVGGYGMDGQKEDPFAVVDVPSLNPASCQAALAYPEEMQINSLEASLTFKCRLHKDSFGLLRFRDCNFVNMDGHPASNQNDSYIQERTDSIGSALEYLSQTCLPTPTKDDKDGDIHTVNVDFTLTHDQ